MATIAVSNESEASFARITKDGRKLTYELRVLQQPQRARACGSGAKSSADRRPVDPPPVIELKVYEGEQRTDITFNHKANFFVYTTLEAARPMAQPRGQPISQPPVLTGSPVSGAALLDRPSPAAYFIFPDLSVRHEGKYRLSFNLFEELKDTKDEDASPALNNPSHPAHGLMGSGPMSQQAHVHFRLEVRSKPFTVYSAKKFPGLAESTSLSRVVAEQGCRVRIRRDVRMRRRDKSGKDSGDHDDVNSFPSYSEPPSADLYRQPSMEQLQQHPPQPQQPQPVEHNYYAQSNGYSTPQYAQHPPAPSYLPQSRPSSQQQYHPVQPSPVEQSPIQSAYSQGYSQYPQPHTRHPSVSSHDGSLSTPHSAILPPQQPAHPQSYMPQTTLPQSSMPQNNMHQNGMPNSQYQAMSHYASDPMGLGTKSMFWADQHNTAQTLAVDAPHQAYPSQHHQQQPQHPQPQPQTRPTTTSELRAATPNGTHLPPLKTLQPAVMKPEPKSQPPLIPESTNVPDVYGMHGIANMNPASLAASVRTGGKRGYDRVFDAGRSTGYSNGHRQDTSGQDIAQLASDEGLINMDELLNMKMVSYRRANGAMHTRRITSPGEA